MEFETYYLDKEEYPGLKIVKTNPDGYMMMSLSNVAYTGSSSAKTKSLGVKYSAEFNPEDYTDALMQFWKDCKDVDSTFLTGSYNLAEIEKWISDEDKEALYDLGAELTIMAQKAKMNYDAQAPKFVT